MLGAGTGMTQRDGMGREVGEGFRMGITLLAILSSLYAVLSHFSCVCFFVTL